MTRDPRWKAAADILPVFQKIGRASLDHDIQNSHSGNMAVRWTDASGRDRIAITATGSQKGDLDESGICILSPDTTDYGYYKASSETDIHARILSAPGVRASMHAHVKDLVLATLDDVPKPSVPPPFRPVDPLGYAHLGREIPVDWFAVPSGSVEMTRVVPERLLSRPLTVIYAHGAVARGRTLTEAFFRLCVANNSGYIVRLLWKIGADVEELRRRIGADPAACFADLPPGYEVEGDECCDFPGEEEILGEFRKTGARIFDSRLSPFHTGSASVRGVADMLYAPKASMPRDIGGPLLRLPIDAREGDTAEIAMHKAVYARSGFQTVLHCHVPEAEAAAHFIYPGETEPSDRIIPLDAEGAFLYLVIPILPPRFDVEDLVRLLHDYKMVVVRGGGVWAVGGQSLSEVLHHPSSLREICLIRIGAFERGLDLRKMEPAKAKKW